LRAQPVRDSTSSLQGRTRLYSDSAEELGIAEDEYFSRLSPDPEEEERKRQPSTGLLPSSDEDENGSLASPTLSEPSQTTWGAVARQPTVIHREPRAKSREGLLNEFEYESDIEVLPVNPKRKSRGFNKDIEDDADPGLRRATGIDLGRRHARHISAGSAKLLDLKRTSVDSKRMSSSSNLG